METVDFTKPLRQSSKGIIIIFVFNAVKFVKSFFAIFVALGIAFVRKNSFISLTPATIIIIIVGILVFILIVAILKYLNFRFHLNATDFHLSTGIINQEVVVIPKSKIQNVYIQQNFLHQIINVVSLKIESAGDKKSEIEIKALDRRVATQLKKELFNKGQSEVDYSETIEKSNVFFNISIGRLFLEGILHNHFKSFLLIASFAIGLYYQFKDYMEALELNIDVGFVELQNQSLLNLMYINVIVVSIILIISILYSVIKIFIVNFNLEVIEIQKTIEINKGLFNKISLSLTPEKIQNVVVKTNSLKRYFNLYTLSVRQAMTNAKQIKNFEIIALQKQQVSHLLNKLLDNYSMDGEVSKPEPYFGLILASRAILLTIVINAVILSLFEFGMIWINIVWVPLCILFVHVRYKKAYYIVTDKFITLGSGFIDTTTNIMEVNKIQAIQLKQNFFQRRKQITSVNIYTASKVLTIPYIKEKDAKSIHDFLLFCVESKGKDWM